MREWQMELIIDEIGDAFDEITPTEKARLRALAQVAARKEQIRRVVNLMTSASVIDLVGLELELDDPEEESDVTGS